MSFNSNYSSLRIKRLLEERMKKEGLSSNSNPTKFEEKYAELRADRIAQETEKEIAPVTTTKKTTLEAPITTKKEQERSWFQKGAFDDGYQFGDVTKTILGTGADIIENVGAGLLGMGESAVDTVVGLGALATKNGRYTNRAYSSYDPVTKKWIDNAREEATQSMTDFVAKDLYDEEKVAKAIISAPLKAVTGSDADELSILGEKTDSLAQSAGQLLGTVGLQAIGVPWFVTTGITSYGSGVEEALNEGATIGEASLSAAITAGAEMLTEKISGGISFGGKTLDDALTKQISRGVSNKVVRTLTKLGVDMAGEGTEEVLSGAMSAIGQKLTYADDKELSELFSSDEALESFIGGAVLGGVGSGVNAVKSNKAGVDYVTELTENEQKVVDKLYKDRVTEAEENGKITQKEKSKIYDSVLNDLEKGYISTDDIESILGGDTYKSYKDTIDSEDALKQELEELRQMKNGDRNDIQNDRLAELKAMNLDDTSKRDSLKSKLSEEVFGLAKDSRLAESYNEQTRRGQYFEADLSKYDKKYQDIIQKAINSKTLNNTNRTHELVDMIAKISADKGVSFDFTNNAKLKESGFGIDGKTINGFVTKDGITLNTDSAKYLNSVVGHEVTHVLEGTEFYKELQNTLIEYAKTKNDYQGRFDSLTELYKGVEGADINAELTADLVGDYLFTDSDFINKLSTEHRNVFQKIYDEIKYLYKVATAGSKEARELEKVKRAFDKAYKESGKVTDTKYSLTNENITDVSTGYASGESYYTMSYKQEGKVVGTLEYGEYDGQPNVKMIEVDPEYRRKGIGTKLLQELQNKYPETEIDFGMATPDGTKLLDAITYDVTDEAVVADRQKLKDLQTELNDLQEKLDILYDTENLTEAQETELHKLGDRWTEVYDTIRELEKSLRGKRATKTFVKTDTKYSLSDSDGKQLTKEQGEYFKDSKVRDDNGNLKVMYHGSQDAGFHVFDSKMSDDGTSFFFVDRNDVAASYSGTTETYEAQTIRTAEDMNNFIKSIDAEGYEVVEKDGKFTLLYEGDRVADSNTAQGIYSEFCWYEGVGEGDANYKVYLNLKNPLIVDAEGRNWNNISREYSQEVADRYNSLTAEEKAALTDLAEWGEYSIFRDEMLEARASAEQGGSGIFDEAYTKNLASAYEKLGGANANLYDAFSIAQENFSEESIKQFAMKQMNTRDYAQRAKEQGYDGVILNNVIDNGGYSNGSEGASNVAIAFSPEQIKSVANTKPTTDPDIRYSLSADSNGNSLSPAVQKRFENSKAVDENGDLKVLYHGTATGEFSIFDKAKGNVEGDFGSGFYFTDNEADVSEHYEGGGPDFDIKVDRRAEQIYNEALDDGNEISYEEAEKRAREELFKGSHKFEVYLNIENPAIVGETNLLTQDKYLEEYNEEDYEDYDDYIADVEQLVADDIEGIVWEIEKNVDVDNTEGIANILYDAYIEGGIGIEELKAKINELYLEDSNGNLVGNEVARQIIESLGYDGIIDPTVAGKWNMDIEPGTTHYIAFKPNQIKAISNQNPTDNPDIHRSLSREGEQPKKYGNLHISGEDVAYQGVAPVKETKKVTEENIFPDDYAPMTEQEAAELQREMIENIDDADAPPERDTEYDDFPDTTRLDSKAEQDLVESLKNVLSLDAQETQAMQEVIQKYSTAEFPNKAELFHEIRNKFGRRTWTTKDELASEVKKYLRTTKVSVSQTIKSDIPNYNSFRKKNCFGKVRISNEGVPVDSLYMELSELYPSYFPADITNPTDQFMQMVDVANASTEIVESYKLGDEEIQAVVNIITSSISNYKETEVMNAAEADRQAFIDEVTEGSVKAPIKETEVKKAPKTENVEAPVKEEKIAKLLPPKTVEPKRNKLTPTQARTLFLDKQAPIEDLSLETGNRELMAKADYLHRVDSVAQRFIGKGTDGVRALLDLRTEVENSGLYEEFKEYMHDWLNVDRMSIESNAKKKIDSLQGKFALTLKHNQIQAIAAQKITKKTTPKTAQTIREAREYLNALDARNKPVYGDSVTADISRAKVAKTEAKHPEFKQWAKDFYGITEHLRKVMVDGDVISQETADLLAEMYPHYIPIRRSGKDGAAVNVPLDTRKTGVNTPLKRATGGNSDIEDMFDTLASRIEQTYKAVARNSLGIELKNTLGAEGIKKTATVDEIDESFDNHEELLKKGENGMNPTFTIFENGERVEFEITEDLYNSLKPKNDFFRKEIKPLNVATKIQRGILTEYNLVFMATNAVKDAQSVLVNSQHPLKTYRRFPEAVLTLANKAITGKESTYLKEYLEHGGEDITYFDNTSNAFSKEDEGIKKWLGFAPRKISEANNFIERIPRLAEYIASREAGRSIEVSMLDAARVTTNFAAGGDATKWANSNLGMTFLNASVEGFNQQVRNIREAKAKGLKGMLQLGAKYAVAGLPVMLLNQLLWDDDEEYEELSDYIKDNYYIVGKTQDGKFIRIPKGREIAVIQNAFEQMKNLITGDDEVDMGRFGELLVENIAPNNPLTNNVLAPIIQAHTNTAWYGGDIVPARLQDLPLAEQYDESTDAISRWLGEKIPNLSPYRFNYLLDQYSGGIGDVFLPMLTPATDGGGVLAPWQDKFITDSTMKNQNVTDFYTTKDELTTNAKSSKATDEDILKSKYINSVNADLSELYAQKREIQNSALSDKEKDSAVRDIQERINAMTRESLSAYKDVSINGEYATVGNLHYKLNKEGEWEKITDKQLEKQEEVTSGLGISPEEYWSNKTEYDFAYESPEKYQVARAVGGFDAYKTYSSELYDIKADKDENGKSITGSRKEKVVEYINNLDADYGEKIILFKSEYNADDTYNYEIIDYLNSRDDISYTEMETILKELGFNVSADGTISWD